ncbi:MAG: hypothetical protein ABJL99_25945 [Aliishimia sp.]
MSAPPSFAKHQVVELAQTSVTQERHARQNVRGNTLWLILVDLASHCGTHSGVNSSASCFGAAMLNAGPKRLPKLQ